MKKFLILFCLLSFLSAQATTWVQYDDKKYIDKDSLQYYVDDYGYIKYNQKTFWTKTLNDNSKYFKESEKFLKNKIWYVIDKKIIDYGNNSIAYKSSTYYDIEENVVVSYTNKDALLEWSPIVPDSIGAFLFELVKHPKNLKKLYKLQQAEKSETIE